MQPAEAVVAQQCIKPALVHLPLMFASRNCTAAAHLERVQRLRVGIQLLCLQLHGRLQASQCLDQQNLTSRRIFMLQRIQGGLQQQSSTLET